MHLTCKNSNLVRSPISIISVIEIIILIMKTMQSVSSNPNIKGLKQKCVIRFVCIWFFFITVRATLFIKNVSTHAGFTFIAALKLLPTISQSCKKTAWLLTCSNVHSKYLLAYLTKISQTWYKKVTIYYCLGLPMSLTQQYCTGKKC